MKASRVAGTLGLTAALVLTGTLPAFGAVSNPVSEKQVVTSTVEKPDSNPVMAKISKDAAIKLVKALVDIPVDFKLTNSRYEPTGWQTDNGSWNLNFERIVKERYSSINVAVDAETGKLISYYLNNNELDKKVTYPPKVDLLKAKEIANQLLLKMNPDVAASVVYNDSYDKLFRVPLQGQVRYSLRFDRSVNGVKYPADGISFEIDGDGQMVSYNYSWHVSRKFASAVPVIKQDQALDTYKVKNKPFLQYIVVTPPGGKSQIALSYSLLTNPLDAATGEMISPYYMFNPGSLKTITEKPLAAKPVAGKDITEDQAVAIAKKLVVIPAGAVLQNPGFTEYQDTASIDGTRATWEISWRVGKENDKDKVYYRAAVNAKTGELVSYSYDNQKLWQPLTTAEEKIRITDEKAQLAVEEFLKKVLPQYSNELAIVKPSISNSKFGMGSTSRTMYFDVRRIIGGISTEMDSVSVSIDLLKGTVVNYYSNISAYKYPTVPNKTIELAKAQDLLLAPYTLELQYYDDQINDRVYFDSNYKKDLAPAKLAYMLQASYYDNVYLDAETGNWRKRDTGEVTIPGKVVVTDIAEHPAQRELQLMVDYQALDVKDGKVNPEQVITRGEFIKMLVITLNGGNYYPYFSSERSNSYKDVKNDSALFGYVESAVDAGILDRSSEVLDPDGKMNREEMAQLIVRALGFDKLANQAGLFNLDTMDAGAVKLKGQAAIVLSLGIMSKSNGSYFMPANEVTRAEAAVAFFHFLEVRPTMQSSSLQNNYRY
ncbi:MAG: S-layer homology domain-containing protein [Gorillibacterium sp.]|nr:S-layer homology domain-containing protein [Gorillibacterium sp.]